MAIVDVESNPCIRCGKERIKGKATTVLLGSIQTKITVYQCPDKECQKLVDKKISEKEERKAYLLNRSRERINNRRSAAKAS